MNPDYYIADEEYAERLRKHLKPGESFTIHWRMASCDGHLDITQGDDFSIEGGDIRASVRLYYEREGIYVRFPRACVRKIELANGKVIYGQKNPEEDLG